MCCDIIQNLWGIFVNIFRVFLRGNLGEIVDFLSGMWYGKFIFIFRLDFRLEILFLYLGEILEEDEGEFERS
jgi:hypothetical protein